MGHMKIRFRSIAACFGILAGMLSTTVASCASEFIRPWKNPENALVIDAYEYNPINWLELKTDKRIAGFINKASDGLPPRYRCRGNETEFRLCKALWKRYAVAKELYHTRRMMAKSLGLLWGAYHLGRPGNPIEQANHFIRFADPQPDELIAIDIEDNTADWMSLEDAEIFAKHIHKRLGRWPVLYTNGNTSKFIADNRASYPLLSRLNLWYARYKPAIDEHFPKGNWTGYALWQFATQINCSRRSCPYRPPGTPKDIDVNVAAMSKSDLQKAWPFSGLVDPIPTAEDMLIADNQTESAGRVPLPTARSRGMEGQVVTRFADAVHATLEERMKLSFRLFSQREMPAAIQNSDTSDTSDMKRNKNPGHELQLALAHNSADPDNLPRQSIDRITTSSVSVAQAMRFAPSRSVIGNPGKNITQKAAGRVPSWLRRRDTVLITPPVRIGRLIDVEFDDSIEFTQSSDNKGEDDGRAEESGVPLIP